MVLAVCTADTFIMSCRFRSQGVRDDGHDRVDIGGSPEAMTGERQMYTASAYAKYLRDEADRCRKLATLCSLPDISAKLLAAAHEYTEQAAALDCDLLERDRPTVAS